MTDVFVSPESSNPSRGAVCRCTNVGILIDDESTLHIYVEDVLSVRLCTYTFNSTNKLVLQELGACSESLIFTDYSNIRNTTLTYKAKKIPKLKKTRYQDYDESLVRALDKHKDTQAE